MYNLGENPGDWSTWTLQFHQPWRRSCSDFSYFSYSRPCYLTGSGPLLFCSYSKALRVRFHQPKWYLAWHKCILSHHDYWGFKRSLERKINPWGAGLVFSWWAPLLFSLVIEIQETNPYTSPRGRSHRCSTQATSQACIASMTPRGSSSSVDKRLCQGATRLL